MSSSPKDQEIPDEQFNLNKDKVEDYVPSASPYTREVFAKDFFASIVVFLVALPLCMGIAIASGVPVMLGLISGIIGGIIVALFAGCPLQVSGPAAGLAVMSFEFVAKFGIKSLVPLGIIVGCFQLAVNFFKLADYFKALSPALIKGLLSAIGLLILVSQVHVAFDALPKSSGLQNISLIPSAFYDLVILDGGGRIAFGLTLLTLFSIVTWDLFAKKVSKVFPAPLFAILVVAIGAFFFGLDVKYINISSNFADELNLISASSFSGVSASLIFAALAIGFVATAETLLSVTAVDKMSALENSDYNKEAKAQGIGNIVAGFFGALPITGVIVRSSANVTSGGLTKWSAFMHGIWLIALTFVFTDILSYIPVSALAGILIFVGWKLLNPKAIFELFKANKREFSIFMVTFLFIVFTDLLTGVVAGFIFSIAILAFDLSKLDVDTEENEESATLQLHGSASFLQVPKVARALTFSESKREITLDLRNLKYMDSAIEEQIEEWKKEQDKKGIKIFVKA